MAALAKPKMTVFFKGDRGEGWTESWYLPAGLDDALCVTRMDQYVEKRKEALGAGAVIQYGRISDDDVLRDSFAKAYSDKDGQGSVAPGVGANAGFGSDCVIHRVEAGRLHRKTWMVRGLSDDSMDRSFPNGFDPGAPTIIAVKKLALWMIANNFGFRIKTANGPPPVYAYIALTRVEPIRWATRRCGRPFGQPVGRRM